MQDKKQQLEPDMEQRTSSKLGKEYIKAYLTYKEYIIQNAALDDSQAGIKISRRNISKNVNNLRYAGDTTLLAKNEEGL